MRIRPFVLPAVATTLVLFGPLLGYEAAVHAASAPSPSKPHHVYRLDYSLSVTEPGKAAVTNGYVLNVEEGQSGDVHAGANIPLQTSSSSMASPRQDVGVKLHCQVTRVGGDLLIHNNTELSGPDEHADQGARAIHKISGSGDAVVTPGKSALVTSIEEPVSHTRYEVTVTATKLR
jgi:hypothetical protein